MGQLRNRIAFSDGLVVRGDRQQCRVHCQVAVDVADGVIGRIELATNSLAGDQVICVGAHVCTGIAGVYARQGDRVDIVTAGQAHGAELAGAAGQIIAVGFVLIVGGHRQRSLINGQISGDIRHVVVTGVKSVRAGYASANDVIAVGTGISGSV